MSIFDKQVKEREAADGELLSAARAKLIFAVTGKGAPREDGLSTELKAIDAVLKYFRAAKGELPDGVTDKNERFEYLLRPSGIMHRPVKLTEGWYKNSTGPLMVYTKDGCAEALLPKGNIGYKCFDPETQKWSRLSAAKAKQFVSEAECFYKPLPSDIKDSKALFRFMFKTLSVADVFLIALCALAAVLLGMFTPMVTNIVISSVIPGGEPSFLLSAGAMMIGVFASLMMVNIIKALLVGRVTTKVIVWTEAAVVARLISLPIHFFEKYSSGELTSRAMNVETLCQMMVSLVFSVGLSTLFSLFYLLQIFKYTLSLTLPAALITAVLIAFIAITAAVQGRISEKTLESSAKLEGLSGALFSGIQKIKLAGAEKRAFAKWASGYSAVARFTYNPPLIIKLNPVLGTLIMMACTLLLYFCALETGVSRGEYVTFFSAFGMVTSSLVAMLPAALSLGSIRPLLTMLAPILTCKPEADENKLIVNDLSGEIEASRLFFQYSPSAPIVLQDLSLHINAGEYIGIVGRTGCGKSTLLRLLLGFETPHTGAVYYDKFDMSKLDLKSLRRQIGVVMQSSSLITANIYENIIITAPYLTEEDAWEAAETADIADDIRAMPMGMRTIVSEGSSSISGGQRQRLMIARAIAPKPKILFFDEATSALDNISQKKISDALDSMGCTRVVIAHRLSTIKNCDRILVLADGHIAEQGSYAELLQKSGYFADLVEKQRLDSQEI